MNIFRRVEKTKKDALETEHLKYLKFLSTLNINAPSEADSAKLTAFMEALGLSAEKVEQDHGEIQGVQSLIRTVDETKGAPERIGPLYEKYIAACEDRQKLHHEQNDRVRVANGEQEQARTDADRHSNAKRQLSELKDTNAALFVAVVEPIQKRLGL